MKLVSSEKFNGAGNRRRDPRASESVASSASKRCRITCKGGRRKWQFLLDLYM